MAKEIMLHAVGIDKQFGPTHAVDHVSLDFYKGEIHALIGENGSGKSTFTNMLTGIISIGEGTFELDGEQIAPKNQVDANHHGAAVIVQEQGTLDGLTVAENMFLGDENQFITGGIKNTGAMIKKAQELLDSYGLDYIKAVDPIDNYNLLFNVMNKVREDGRTVIFISHDMAEVLSMSDTISILRDGEYITTVSADEVDEEQLKTLMVGREMSDHYYREDYDGSLAGDVAISMKDVSVPGELEEVSLDLHKGEILGIGGLSECGMHEVGKALFGASYERTGEVELGDGTAINDINTAINHSIAYASKDRDNESLLIADTIQDNITLPSLRKMGLPLSKSKQKKFANEYAELMSVKMVNTDQFVIYALMDEMRKQGKAILVISEEIMELIGMCDRILVMKDHKINGELQRSKELTEQDLIALMV